MVAFIRSFAANGNRCHPIAFALCVAFLAALPLFAFPSLAFAEKANMNSYKPLQSLRESASSVSVLPSLKDELAKKTSEQICEFAYTNKAKTEAIAITARQSAIWGLGYDRGKIWFVKSGKAELIYTASKTLLRGAISPEFIWKKNVKGGFLFAISDGNGRSAKTKLFFVGNGQAYNVAIVGRDIRKEAPNQFSTCVQGFARAKTTTTWHRYYFRWNGKKLVEYGGKEFSPNRLKKAKNGNRIVRTILNSGSMRTAYYRSNGIINVNCVSHGQKERFNVVLRYKDGKLSWTKQNAAGNAFMRSSWDGWAKKRIPGGAGIVPVSYPSKLPEKLRASGSGKADSDNSSVKTRWYMLCFTPKSAYRDGRNDPYSIYHVSGCKATVGKSFFRVKGKAFRGSSIRKLRSKPKLLSYGTRTFKVASKVKFYGTNWTDPPIWEDRAYVLSLVKSWNKSRFGTLSFKCKGNKVVEIRCSAA